MYRFEEQFRPFAERMRSEGLPEIFIDVFASYYEQLISGETGLIAEKDIEPAEGLPVLEELPLRLAASGEDALAHTVLIKLNGGLGTSMGLERAKSLLEAKEGLNFLDITARHALRAGVPLMLMNSFATDEDSLNHLTAYPGLHEHDLPLTFLQHKEPKVMCAGFAPACWAKDPSLEWCPPGHGDIYTALVTRGILKALLDHGYRWAFVSNADNLGAALDLTLLGYLAEKEVPFIMEVAHRTEMDKKGGHLARRRSDGRLILRESAQCPAADEAAFQDVARHSYFNTNNLWLDLQALQRLMDERKNRLGLPMIRNEKTIDPRDLSSPCVYQLETAMGSAIGVFEGSQAIQVPRDRFAPVKTTEDLLAIRSDAYVMSEDFRVFPDPVRGGAPLVIDLDPEHYTFVTDLEARFPSGPPSLLQCRHLKVSGDFRFEDGVACQGSVTLENDAEGQKIIPPGTVLGR